MSMVCRGLAFAAAGLAIGASSAVSAQEASASRSGFGLTCEVHCSETRPRTGIATLTWTGPRGRAGASALAGGSGAASVDVSVFAGGLDEGRYVSFDAFGEGAAPRAPSRTDSTRGAERRELRAYDLRVGASRSGEAVDLAGASARDVPTDADRVAIELENLEPGLNYSFRLRPPGGGDPLTVTCEAPVCPADIREERTP